jgi:hypothetical protein
MGVKRGIVAVEEDPGMLNKKMKNTNVTMGKESVDTTGQESVKNYVHFWNSRSERTTVQLPKEARGLEHPIFVQNKVREEGDRCFFGGSWVSQTCFVNLGMGGVGALLCSGAMGWKSL